MVVISGSFLFPENHEIIPLSASGSSLRGEREQDFAQTTLCELCTSNYVVLDVIPRRVMREAMRSASEAVLLTGRVRTTRRTADGADTGFRLL